MNDASPIQACLPYDLEDLRPYFQHEDSGDHTSNPDQHLDAIRRSVQRVNDQGWTWEQMRAGRGQRPENYARPLQFFKDETILTAVAMAALDRCRRADQKAERVKLLDGFMTAALRGPWVGFHEPRLWLERQIRAPASYLEDVHDRDLVSRHPVRYVREVPRPKTRLEGPTHVDALIKDGEENARYVLVEAKFLSDMSVATSLDPERNQIARNLDVGLDLVGGDASRLYVVLLTPERFRQPPTSRLYAYKLRDYRVDPHAIRRDLPHRGDEIDWHRLSENLGWASWEDVTRLLAHFPSIREDERARLREFFSDRLLWPCSLPS